MNVHKKRSVPLPISLSLPSSCCIPLPPTPPHTAPYLSQRQLILEASRSYNGDPLVLPPSRATLHAKQELLGLILGCLNTVMFQVKRFLTSFSLAQSKACLNEMVSLNHHPH